MGHTTQLCSLFQQCHCPFPPLLFDFYRAAHQRQCAWSDTCHHTCIQIQTSNLGTREGVINHVEIPCIFLPESFETVPLCLSIPKGSHLVKSEKTGMRPLVKTAWISFRTLSISPLQRWHFFADFCPTLPSQFSFHFGRWNCVSSSSDQYVAFTIFLNCW